MQREQKTLGLKFTKEALQNSEIAKKYIERYIDNNLEAEDEYVYMILSNKEIEIK